MFVTLIISLALLAAPGRSATPTFEKPEKRAAALLSRMTTDEKISMLHGPASDPCCQCNTSQHGGGCAYVGNVVGNDRLGIPPLTMNDGPQGFRDDQNPGTTTAWPSGLTMAASFDVDAISEWGRGMGAEFFNKGANIQLGPGLCLARVPRNGRNFEYLSGEDPYLGYSLVQPAIRGIQSQGVMANAKHYIANNQETNRNAVIENVDERTRFEMYYPPFAGAVAADVGSIMCSYNKIRPSPDGSFDWSCENNVTLAHDLKEEIGFQGFVMSDWGATHSMSIGAGLDMEMPSASFMNGERILAAVAAGDIAMSAVDSAVLRILTPMYSVGIMDAPNGTWSFHKLASNVTTEESVNSARRLSALSTVLLKNDEGLLPLRPGAKIALVGFCDSAAVVHAGGSGSVAPSYVATPLIGIAAANVGGSTSCHDGTDMAAATAAAAAADVAIVFVGTLSAEGSDRVSLSLDVGCGGCGGNSQRQNAMIEAIAKSNPNNTVVVMSVPGAVLTPWAPAVKALLTNFMPGQQAGNAIADVLFGDVNPSARLPITMPNKENEQNFSTSQWPGLPDPSNPREAVYSEGLEVGYRYYQAHGIAPAFPFGHGLSFTTFSYGHLVVTAKTVAIDITNTGTVDGAEVPQLYLGFPASSGEPPKQLKGFRKTSVLKPGETVTVTFNLTDRDVSIWDVSTHAWAKQTGTFGIFVGSSCEDIRATGSFSI